jgi:hypothetical protein
MRPYLMIVEPQGGAEHLLFQTRPPLRHPDLNMAIYLCGSSPEQSEEYPTALLQVGAIDIDMSGSQDIQIALPVYRDVLRGIEQVCHGRKQFSRPVVKDMDSVGTGIPRNIQFAIRANRHPLKQEPSIEVGTRIQGRLPKERSFRRIDPERHRKRIAVGIGFCPLRPPHCRLGPWRCERRARNNDVPD